SPLGNCLTFISATGSTVYFSCAATTEGISHSPAANINNAATDRPADKDRFTFLLLTLSRSVCHARDRRHCLSGRISFPLGFPPFFLWRRVTVLPGDVRNLVLRYHFEDCVLDTDRRELHRNGSLVPVEPQVFDLLVHLMRHREQVVTRDELL